MFAQCLAITFPGIDVYLLRVWLRDLVLFIGVKPLVGQHGLQIPLILACKVVGGGAEGCVLSRCRACLFWGPASSAAVLLSCCGEVAAVLCSRWMKSFSSFSLFAAKNKNMKILPARIRCPAISIQQYEKTAQIKRNILYTQIHVLNDFSVIMAMGPCGLMHNESHDGGVFLKPTCHHVMKSSSLLIQQGGQTLPAFV